MNRTRRPILALLALALLPALAGAQPDRSRPPELGPPRALELPPVERFALANGLEVWLLEKRQVPLVQVNLVIRSGSVDDPKTRPGLAAMTAAMLDEGAGERDALELADAVDFLGADLSTWSGYHASGVDLSVPTARLDQALTLAADVALRPTFPSAELERQRLEQLTQLLQNRDEPRALAALQFDRTLYGPDHAYGRNVDEASLRALTSAELAAFHAVHFTPANAALVVVGDVTAEAARPLLEAAFGAWRGAAASEPAGGAEVAPAKQVAGRKLYLVDKPGAAQSEIRIGRIGVERAHPDYFPLVVMNTVLGGSFTSRLNSNLREDKGYTYGARSGFAFRSAGGPFAASSAVETGVTDKALVEFMRELRGIATISAEELSRAQNFVALRFPRRFQTVAGIARELTELVVHDLPAEYLNRYVERVLAVEAADVARVAREHVDPENLALVIVGDREVIEEGVAALELGPIEHLTVEDVLGPAPEL